MRHIAPIALAFALAGLGVVQACSDKGDGRESSEGKQVKGSPMEKPPGDGGTTAGGTTAGGTDAGGNGAAGAGGTGQEGEADGVGTVDGGEVQTPNVTNAKTLEQCEANNQAWRAVVNGGTSPADCVDALEKWCCTRTEIKARFNTMADKLEAKFAQFIDTEGHKLYHCSVDAAGKKHSFHMAKIGSDGSVSYRVVYVSDVFPVEPANPETNCAKVGTNDLKVDGGVANDGGAALTFDADIKPILAGKCGGNNCHADGGGLPAASQFLNSEAKFKASDAVNRLNGGTMPPAGSQALTQDEKDKLLQFLQ